ncbi:MAG TPA: glycine cleavage system protein GcvH [Gammaproteobacteria bacterium]|nr:glycine cleavage system protein GcvH [Gammaproteobacteria bacterium]
MSEIPADLKYTDSHEWVRLESDGLVTVGVTDHAQHALGDLVFVELPEVGNTADAGDAVAVVESVKAASDIYAPLSGEIVEANDLLVDAPEKINEDPYGDGWIFRMKIEDESVLDGLLDAEAYASEADE